MCPGTYRFLYERKRKTNLVRYVRTRIRWADSLQVHFASLSPTRSVGDSAYL